MPTAQGTTTNTTTRDSHDTITINLNVANGNDIDDKFVKELMARIKKKKNYKTYIIIDK